ncbi:MAG: hypothetical protein ABI867_40615 [Kofleriaceae bacterium]
MFLDQFTAALRMHQRTSPEIAESAKTHGGRMLQHGFSIDEVVRYYGDVCQTISDLVIEHAAQISAHEFQTLNMCLDDAIAGAVSEYGREEELVHGTDGLESIVEELRELIATAMGANAAIMTGQAPISGLTAGVLDTSLQGLKNLVDRSFSGCHSSRSIG